MRKAMMNLNTLKGAAGKKLKSNSGESIAETLVAVLISAFALLMLAGTINTASNLITKGQDNLGKYYAANNNLAEHKTSSSSLTITVKDSAGSELEEGSVSGYTPGNSGTDFGKSLIAYG